jgi:hypothetical protein
MNQRFTLYGLLLASLLSLTACAGFTSLSSDVSSFGVWPAERKPASFAFERLPSQARHSARQDRLETAATAALQNAGFTQVSDTKSADVLVMVGARISVQEISPWDDPFWWGYRRSFWHYSPRLRPYSSYYLVNRRYEREVAVVLRDRQGGAVLYEGRAANDGLSEGDDRVLQAMFEAALSDFPRTVPEPHDVVVPLSKR